MQTFNDEQSVPVVPEHVKASGNHARSVGLCDLDGKAPSELRSHRDGIGRLTLPRKGEASHSACRCVTVREESSGSQT